MTLIATLTLAVAVLFPFPPDLRMGLCIIVSVAAITLAVRGLLIGKLVVTPLFLAVVGVFTPFSRAQFSRLLISELDMATLALLAVSPILLRESTSQFVLEDSKDNVAITRH